MSSFNDHFNNYIRYINDTKSNKQYKLAKRFLYMTHLKGPHIDFYNNPLGFNGKTLEDKVINLRSKFIKAMICVIHCEKKRIYTNQNVVVNILNQLKMAVSNRSYWRRYGFNKDQSKRIIYSYGILINFYSEYLLKKHKGRLIDGVGRSDKGNKLYRFFVNLNSSLDIDPSELQRYAFKRLAMHIKRFGELTENRGITDSPFSQENLINEEFKKVMSEKRSKETPITSESQLLIESRKVLMRLQDKIGDMFNDDVKIPDTSKVSVKALPTMNSKWSSKGSSNKNTVYINTTRYESHTIEQLERTLAHEGVPGHLLQKINNSRVLKSVDVDKDTLPILVRGVGMMQEGWAIYCEKRMLEDNQYNNELLLLKDIYYDIRTIIDVGLHYSRGVVVTVEDAVELLQTYTMMDDTSISLEINRILADPGSGTVYMLGSIFYDKLFEIIADRGIDVKNAISKMVKYPLNAEEMYKFILKPDNINDN